MAAATVSDSGLYHSRVRDDIRDYTGPWWLWIIFGIAWIWLSLLVLQFDLDSIYAIGLLFAIVMIVAGVEEVFAVFVLPGWKWLHALMAVLFLFAGVWALAYPGQTFGTLALLVGWFLLIKGTFDIIVAIASHGTELWWLTLIVGMLEIGLAFWATAYPGRSATLLILWVGISALMRGITSIVLAFQMRSLRREVVV